ncbi:indole-2-monooxygenase isoform X2 [Triticum aestivum]|uniref:indole-2-monooxygenase isoform X2 n=1 Tax=Triticum aestivum TaxID=4565 RepID=UPI001D02B04E|nr:indole-2-monooxygenase-like isoform X2 [Triticum aestivum]
MRGDMAQVLTIFSPEVLLSLLLCFFVLRRYYLARRSANNCSDHGRRLPPSPPKLPLIGHLHLVGPDPHISLAELSRKHAGRDGLMLLRLGQVPNLVVSSPSAAEAVLRTHDHVFASRPPSIVAGVLLSGPSDVALTPYGEYWRQARKLVTTHLLSARKVRALQGGREEEVRLVVAKLRAAAAARSAVDMTELLGGFTNDVVCRAVSGKFFREEGRNELFRELIAGNVAAIGGFNLEDYFPSLAKVGLLRRVVLGKTRRLKKRWDELLDKIIDDHATKSPWLVGVHQHQPNEQEQNQQDEDRDLDMFSAGTDTSSIVLEFAMAELMRKPHLMAKLQADVRSKTPKTQQTVKEDDLGNMSYLKAVVKETLRLHPPAPLLLPHLSMAECDDVNGYMVPAGTRVIINAWALCRDTESWGMKAEEFWPERFIDGAKAAADFKGRDFQFLPFGAGRRICPGMGFGLATVEAMLANLVYCFDWELPDGMREEDVDMADVFGVTMRRKEKLVLVPRIPQDANI